MFADSSLESSCEKSFSCKVSYWEGKVESLLYYSSV